MLATTRLGQAAVLAILGMTGAQAEEAAPPFRSMDFDGSRSCAPCHPKQYLDWRGSAHAYALLDPIYRGCGRHAFESTGGEIGDHCLICHSPIGARSKELRPLFDPQALSPHLAEGITCETCHVMQPPADGGVVADANFDLRPSRVFLGRLTRAQDNTAHANAHSDYLGRSESCGVCHDVIFKSLSIESSFAEWAASPFVERGVQCQDCHMLRYSGQAAVGGPLRDTLRRHNFPGVTLPPAGFPNRGYQQEEVGAFLRTALRVSVDHPGAAQAGAAFPITVTLKNSGTGHNFPTASFRQLWIEVTVIDDRGNAIFRSGDLDDNGDLMDGHSALNPGADRFLASFSDYFVDDKDRPVPYWFASRVVQRSLRPLEERNITYRVPVPAQLAGESLRARIRVLFRAFRPYAMRDMGLVDLARELPVWELDSHETGSLPVVLEVPRKTGYRLPGDFTGIEEAFDGLRDGDHLTVDAGEYIIRGPLDFRGRRLEVRAPQGAFRTRIRYASEIPEEERSSVVVFRGGEGPDSVLEGFALEGGAGTMVDGMRRGGGIHITGSSPTIRGNRIEACGARGGVGGGICVEEGEPVLGGNTVAGCWADRGGGLGYRGGRGALTLRDDAFEGNLARQGGGLYVEARGRLRVEGCLFAGNLATATGGAIHAADTAQLAVSRATFVHNQAGEGPGALRVDPRACPPVSSAIFWSNVPPGVEADLEYCSTDFEGPEFPGRMRAYPLFIDPTGFWDVVPETSALADRIPPELLPAGWSHPRKWVTGNYGLLPGSPAIDAGNPEDPVDPDDTRADIGGLHFQQHLRGFIRGDVNGDGNVNVDDLLLLVRHLQEAERIPCRDAADVDDDGIVSPQDAVYLGSYLSAGEPTPAQPFPRCHVDPTPGEGVSCEEESPACRS